MAEFLARGPRPTPGEGRFIIAIRGATCYWETSSISLVRGDYRLREPEGSAAPRPAMIAAPPPMVSHTARSVGCPVKNFENWELNESVARRPITSSATP